MITDDATGKIVELAMERMGGIDHTKLRSIISEVLYGYTITEKEGYESVSDVSEKTKIFFNTMRLDGMSEKTIKNYGYHLRRFAQYAQKPVSRISTQDIRAFLAMLVETNHLKNTTLETEKSILKSFFSWLEEEEYIDKNPAQKIKPTKVEKRLRKSLTMEELELMRDGCKTNRQRCMFEMFYSTGMRLDELSKVNIAHINWQEQSIKVIGKGNKERIVYFTERAKVHLKKYIAERGTLGTDALFVGIRSPHSRLGHKAIQNEIKKIAAYARMDKSIYPHLLRHSFATQGLRSGMSINVIHDLLGHEDLDTTLRYAQTDRETAKYEYRKHGGQ